jgi:hypothetical protein
MDGQAGDGGDLAATRAAAARWRASQHLDLDQIRGEADCRDNETALRLAGRILDMDRARFGAVHPRVAVDLNNAALIRMRLGQLQEADAMYAEAVDVLRATGTRSPGGEGRDARTGALQWRYR